MRVYDQTYSDNREDGKSDYQRLAEEIIRPAKDKLAAKAKAAFLALPKAKRIRIRKEYKRKREHFTFTDWHHKQQEAKRTNGEGDGQENGARAVRRDKGKVVGWTGKATRHVDNKDGTPNVTYEGEYVRRGKGKGKKAARGAGHRYPYLALMRPMVIVPDDPEGKVAIADAGSVIRPVDQVNLYRDRTSPITRRGDETLVQYGKASDPSLGWMAHLKVEEIPTSLKATIGPTFLVTTKDEDALPAWDQLRLKVARTRKSDPTNWIAPWLATHGAKHHRTLLREVTKHFGGKTVKGESFEDRCSRLFSLILHTELDVKTAKTKKAQKKSRSGKQAKAEAEAPAKKKAPKSKAAKKAKAKALAGTDPIGSKYNEHVIRRLTKENPFREGSNRAKLWAKLKKGMTVLEFVKKGDGRGRTELRGYVENGWVKLKRPAAA